MSLSPISSRAGWSRAEGLRGSGYDELYFAEVSDAEGFGEEADALVSIFEENKDNPDFIATGIRVTLPDKPVRVIKPGEDKYLHVYDDQGHRLTDTVDGVLREVVLEYSDGEDAAREKFFEILTNLDPATITALSETGADLGILFGSFYKGGWAENINIDGDGVAQIMWRAKILTEFDDGSCPQPNGWDGFTQMPTLSTDCDEVGPNLSQLRTKYESAWAAAKDAFGRAFSAGTLPAGTEPMSGKDAYWFFSECQKAFQALTAAYQAAQRKAVAQTAMRAEARAKSGFIGLLSTMSIDQTNLDILRSIVAGRQVGSAPEKWVIGGTEEGASIDITYAQARRWLHNIQGGTNPAAHNRVVAQAIGEAYLRFIEDGTLVNCLPQSRDLYLNAAIGLALLARQQRPDDYVERRVLVCETDSGTRAYLVAWDKEAKQWKVVTPGDPTIEVTEEDGELVASLIEEAAKDAQMRGGGTDEAAFSQLYEISQTTPTILAEQARGVAPRDALVLAGDADDTAAFLAGNARDADAADAGSTSSGDSASLLTFIDTYGLNGDGIWTHSKVAIVRDLQDDGQAVVEMQTAGGKKTIHIDINDGLNREEYEALGLGKNFAYAETGYNAGAVGSDGAVTAEDNTFDASDIAEMRKNINLDKLMMGTGKTEKEIIEVYLTASGFAKVDSAAVASRIMKGATTVKAQDVLAKVKADKRPVATQIMTNILGHAPTEADILTLEQVEIFCAAAAFADCLDDPATFFNVTLTAPWPKAEKHTPAEFEARWFEAGALAAPAADREAAEGAPDAAEGGEEAVEGPDEATGPDAEPDAAAATDAPAERAAKSKNPARDGFQAFSDGDFKTAIAMFEVALAKPDLEPKIKPIIRYYLAESYYRKAVGEVQALSGASEPSTFDGLKEQANADFRKAKEIAAMAERELTELHKGTTDLTEKAECEKMIKGAAPAGKDDLGTIGCERMQNVDDIISKITAMKLPTQEEATLAKLQQESAQIEETARRLIQAKEAGQQIPTEVQTQVSQALAGAIAKAKAASGAYPTSKDILDYLTQLYALSIMISGDYSEAISFYEAYVAAHAENTEAKKTLMLLYVEQCMSRANLAEEAKKADNTTLATRWNTEAETAFKKAQEIARQLKPVYAEKLQKAQAAAKGAGEASFATARAEVEQAQKELDTINRILKATAGSQITPEMRDVLRKGTKFAEIAARNLEADEAGKPAAEAGGERAGGAGGGARKAGAGGDRSGGLVAPQGKTVQVLDDADGVFGASE